MPFTLQNGASYWRGFKTAMLVLFAAAVPTFAFADTYYVAPTGSDANPGTKSQPFKTLSAACKQTPAGKNTIQLAAGVYPETEACLVPSGVSLVGAGAEKTIIKWPVVVDMETEPGLIAPDKFLIQVNESDGAELSGFTVDGKLEGSDPIHDRAHGGIYTYKVTNFQIHDITARSFNHSGIFFAASEKSSLHHCQIFDCGHPNKKSCSGGLAVGDMTDSSVHDNVIRENRGAYGIKGARLIWGWPKPNTTLARGGANIPLVRSAFYNNDIKVRQQGAWGAGQSNMAMELWNCNPTDCEINNNTFNQCLSLTGGFKGPKTYRVHHNRFILDKGNSYAIEVCTNDMEIDHNYFANGHYPIAQWGGDANRLNIHHNVFDGIEGIDLLHFRTSYKDLQFVNNTVYVKNTFPIFRIGSGQWENVRIANNLFYKEGAPHAPDLIRYEEDKKKPGVFSSIKPGTLIVENNAFYQWTPSGEKAFSGDPLLTRRGKRETLDFFRPLPGSPLIAAGIGATAAAAAP